MTGRYPLGPDRSTAQRTTRPTGDAKRYRLGANPTPTDDGDGPQRYRLDNPGTAQPTPARVHSQRCSCPQCRVT